MPTAGKVFIDVDREKLIQIVEESKAAAEADYEKATAKYESDLAKFRTAAEKALKAALADVDRIDETYSGFRIKGFPSKPSKPEKKTRRHDGDLRLLRAASCDVIKITPN